MSPLSTPYPLHNLAQGR